MRGFTKGPWRQSARGPNNCPVIGDNGGLLIAMVSTGIDFEEEAEANAVLIAAAPELFKALVGLRRWMGPAGLDPEIDDAMKIADAAIAEAQIAGVPVEPQVETMPEPTMSDDELARMEILWRIRPKDLGYKCIVELQKWRAWAKGR